LKNIDFQRSFCPRILFLKLILVVSWQCILILTHTWRAQQHLELFTIFCYSFSVKPTMYIVPMGILITSIKSQNSNKTKCQLCKKLYVKSMVLYHAEQENISSVLSIYTYDQDNTTLHSLYNHIMDTFLQESLMTKFGYECCLLRWMQLKSQLVNNVKCVSFLVQFFLNN